MKNPSKEILENWKVNEWGIFYYNREDERLFPPKRIGWMGWTVNLANPKSIAAMLLLMGFLLFVI
jgi:uncharacterized membrane protein